MSYLNEFISLDIETTGLDPKKHDIIEIAAILFKDEKPIDQYVTYVKTDQLIPGFITSLTGITKQKTEEEGIPIDKALSEFKKFIGNRLLVAHNSRFDIKFINNNLNKIKKPKLSNNCFDTLLISRLAFPDLESYKLENLIDYLDLREGQSHRAENDALSCGLLLIKSAENIRDFDPIKLKSLNILIKNLDTSLAAFIRSLLPSKSEKPPEKKSEIEKEIKPLEKKENLQKISDNEINKLFIENGILSKKFENYTYRKGQHSMALSILRSLNDNEIVVAEAGTGTGKSLAYLCSSIIFSAVNNTRVIISTKTKTLQDQIFKKELPFLKKCLSIDFTYSILKGRSNYLCIRKWREMLSGSNYILRDWEIEGLLPLAPWVETTQTGDVSECRTFNEKENRILWAKISSDPKNCHGSRCRFFGECFLMKKRREALASNIVLINHSLFFTDVKNNYSILGKYENIVFDEAHSFENIGRSHLGFDVAHIEYSTVLQKLYKEENEKGKGLLVFLSSILNSMRLNEIEDLLKKIDDVSKLIVKTEKDSVRFFREIGNNVKKLTQSEKYRYKENFFSVVTLKKELPDIVSVKMRIQEICRKCETFETDEESELKDLLFDLKAVVKDLEHLDFKFNFITAAEDNEYIYWIEQSYNPLNVKLVTVPVYINKIMDSDFFSHIKCAVFTSATLAVKNSLNYFMEKTGISLNSLYRTKELIINSDYDHKKQICLGTIRDLPYPDSEEHINGTIDIITSIYKNFTRKSLILFTSKDYLRKVYNNLTEFCLEKDIVLLAQNITGNSHQLLTEMKKNKKAILLGTDSFWEGIDLPGTHLELLLITKLPFGVPTDPVVTAVSEKLQEQDKNAFYSYYLPEAVIKLRQGMGRLIRSENDFGAALIMDNRIIKKSYGSVFRKSLDADMNIWQTSSMGIKKITDYFVKRDKNGKQ